MQQAQLNLYRTKTKSLRYISSNLKSKIIFVIISIFYALSVSLGILAALFAMKFVGFFGDLQYVLYSASTPCSTYIASKYTYNFFETKVKIINLSLIGTTLLSIFFIISMFIRRRNIICGCCSQQKQAQGNKQNANGQIQNNQLNQTGRQLINENSNKKDGDKNSKDLQKNKKTKSNSQYIKPQNSLSSKIRDPLLEKNSKSAKISPLNEDYNLKDLKTLLKETEELLIHPFNHLSILLYFIWLLLLMIPLAYHLSFYFQWKICSTYIIDLNYLYIFCALQVTAFIIALISVYNILRQNFLIKQKMEQIQELIKNYQQKQKIKQYNQKKQQQQRVKNLDQFAKSKKKQKNSHNKTKQRQRKKSKHQTQNEHGQQINLPMTINHKFSGTVNHNIISGVNPVIGSQINPIVQSLPVAQGIPVKNSNLQIPKGQNIPPLKKSQSQNVFNPSYSSSSQAINDQKSNLNNTLSPNIQRQNNELVLSKNNLQPIQQQQQPHPTEKSFIQSQHQFHKSSHTNLFESPQLQSPQLQNPHLQTKKATQAIGINSTASNYKQFPKVASVSQISAKQPSISINNPSSIVKGLQNNVRQIEMVDLGNQSNKLINNNGSIKKVPQKTANNIIQSKTNKLSLGQTLEDKKGKKKLSFCSSIYSIQQSSPFNAINSNVTVVKQRKAFNQMKRNSSKGSHMTVHYLNNSYEKQRNLNNQRNVKTPQYQEIQAYEDRYHTNRKNNYREEEYLNNDPITILYNSLNNRPYQNTSNSQIYRTPVVEQRYLPTNDKYRFGEENIYNQPNINKYGRNGKQLNRQQNVPLNLMKSTNFRAVPLKQQVYDTRKQMSERNNFTSQQQNQAYNSASSYYHNEIRKEIDKSPHKVFSYRKRDYSYTNKLDQKNNGRHQNTVPWNQSSFIINKTKHIKQKQDFKSSRKRIQNKIKQINQVEHQQKQLDSRLIYESTKYMNQNNYDSVLVPMKNQVKLIKQNYQKQKQKQLRSESQMQLKKQRQRDFQKKRIINSETQFQMNLSSQQYNQKNYINNLTESNNFRNRSDIKKVKQISRQQFADGQPIIIVNDNPYPQNRSQTEKVDFDKQIRFDRQKNPNQMRKSGKKTQEPIIPLLKRLSINKNSDQLQNDQYKQHVLQRRNSDTNIDKYNPVIVKPLVSPSNSMNKTSDKKRNIYNASQKRNLYDRQERLQFLVLLPHKKFKSQFKFLANSSKK